MKDWLKKFKLNQDNIGKILGVIVILLVAIVLIRYVRKVNKPTGQVSDQAAATENITASSDYTIKPGDSLWKISQATYGSGYKWVDLYAANKNVLGTNPDLIYPDIKIVLPKLEEKTTSYTVIRGDNLWNISVRFCGSGFAYPQLVQANSIPNPRLIYPNQILQIKCN